MQVIWQYLIVACVIGASLAFLGRRAVQVWRGRCNSKCGCKPETDNAASNNIIDSLSILKR